MIENGYKHQLNILPSWKINIFSLLRTGGIHRHKIRSQLRANVNMHQTNSGKLPIFVFSPTFIFCIPICPNNCGVVFLWKYTLVFEKLFILSPLHNKQHSILHQISLFREACREPTRGIYSLRHAYIHIFATDIPHTILIYSQFLTH